MIPVLREVSPLGSSSSSRSTSVRYFNLYRIVVASLLGIFTSVTSFGSAAPELFNIVIAIYWVMAVLFAIVPITSERGGRWWLAIQVTTDIWVLTVVMFLSGGQRSGIPYLIMTTIAGAALISEGRMVLGFAAMATLAALFEQFMRSVVGTDSVGDFTRAGISAAGYFAIALIARLLARRAIENEALAKRSQAERDRQVRINARIIDDMLDGVVVVDASGAVRQVNPRATELLGFTLQPGELLNAASPVLALHSQTDNFVESPVFTADASGRNLRLRRVPAGQDGDVVLYLEDIDRVQAQAQQIKLAALGRLTANIAHEIRNPLAAISHAAELMGEEKRSDVLQRLARIVFENCGRIERMVRNVLELGRRDSTTPETLLLAAFLRSFADELAMYAEHTRELITVEVEGNPSILFDRVHLHQILSNLVNNALRFCSGAHASVRILVRRKDVDRISVSVIDDGPGIAQADRAKVFEPFFTSDPKGTGLGLYIARELADANGARLDLVDTEAGGAHFQLVVRSSR